MWCFHGEADDDVVIAPSSRRSTLDVGSIGTNNQRTALLGVYSSPPKWDTDASVEACTACQEQFDLLNRKHHCRACGQVFCSSCTNHTDQVVKYGLMTPVRLCAACAATAQRENPFYAIHFPLLQEGGTFVKQGLLIERTVKMQLVGQQGVAIESREIHLGDVKAIQMDSISSVKAVGAKGLEITTLTQQHRQDALSALERNRWVDALQASIDIRQYHAKIQDDVKAAKVAQEHAEMVRVIEGLDSIEARKIQMQQARLEKNQSRREALRAKYGLN
ncbi:unnamed protein product [Aphanomyces euteiches]